MARRLTTIRSAIKRFQVRPLVRSSLFALSCIWILFGRVESEALARELDDIREGHMGFCVVLLLDMVGTGAFFYFGVVVGMFVGRGIRAFCLLRQVDVTLRRGGI
jgi:hypothetical protein